VGAGGSLGAHPPNAGELVSNALFGNRGWGGGEWGGDTVIINDNSTFIDSTTFVDDTSVW